MQNVKCKMQNWRRPSTRLLAKDKNYIKPVGYGSPLPKISVTAAYSSVIFLSREIYPISIAFF